MPADVCREVEAELRTRPESMHTSQFHLTVAGRLVHNVHFHGPRLWTLVPRAEAVIVTTGDPARLRAGWRPARVLIVRG